MTGRRQRSSGDVCVGQSGLDCFEMGTPWKGGVTGGLSLSVAWNIVAYACDGSGVVVDELLAVAIAVFDTIILVDGVV